MDPPHAPPSDSRRDPSPPPPPPPRRLLLPAGGHQNPETWHLRIGDRAVLAAELGMLSRQGRSGGPLARCGKRRGNVCEQQSGLRGAEAIVRATCLFSCQILAFSKQVQRRGIQSLATGEGAEGPLTTPRSPAKMQFLAEPPNKLLSG